MGALRPGIGMPPPGAHVNPNVFPVPPINETEFEEIMNRNRTVSSSAISRAMSDAHAGDVKAAIETLQTAMNLIKASRVAHDDRCRVLINQLDVSNFVPLCNNLILGCSPFDRYKRQLSQQFFTQQSFLP